jgi:hypothetical protein
MALLTSKSTYSMIPTIHGRAKIGFAGSRKPRRDWIPLYTISYHTRVPQTALSHQCPSAKALCLELWAEAHCSELLE